jgi:hypothetical protein
MKVNTKKTNGYWVDAAVLHTFLIELHLAATDRRANIKLVLSPDKDKLDGILFMIKSTLEFMQNKVIHGTLREKR